MTVLPMPQPTRFNPTDIGNAERLVHRHGADLRFVPKWGRWLVWDDRRWAVDETGEIERRAKDTVRAIYDEAKHARTQDERKELATHAIRSEASNKIKAMVERARVEPSIPIRHTQLDADPWLLTVENGTLDLRTPKLEPHRRIDLVTKLAPAAFHADAACPTWLAFLDRIMAGKADMIEFLQRAVGYSLTGTTSEQCLFFLHGSGANGKSTFLEIVRSLLGDYAVQADIATFLERKSDGGPRNDVARLVGARLVTSSEVGEGRRLNESLVKQLTGSDVVSARFLYQEDFEFTPCFKLWIAANHKPVIRGADDGIWRRVRLVPFTVQIPAAEQDRQLKDALLEELPGILAWAVEGCQQWLESGLGEPEDVRAATAAYRAESDVIGRFLDERCEVGPTYATTAKALFDAYKSWASENGEEELSQTKFGRRLSDRGITPKALGSGRSKITWRMGVKLLDQGGSTSQHRPDAEQLGESGTVSAIVNPYARTRRTLVGKPSQLSQLSHQQAQGELLSPEEEAAAIDAYERLNGEDDTP